MPRWLYATSLVLFVPAYLAMLVGGVWTWALPFIAFVVVPLGEQAFTGSTYNPTDDEERARLEDRLYDALVYLAVPAQVGLLCAYLWRLSVGGYAGWETAGVVATMGVAAATYGINLGHELGHRRTAHEQAMAKILLFTTLYGHFIVEHNRGHHRRVATPEDPATSRRGESVYAFWVRSVVGGWRGAWELENTRLAREGVRWWSWSNEVVRLTLAQTLLVAVVALAFGPVALAGFLVSSLIGVLFLETINYVEHYGLVRERKPHGAYERVQPHHSWNSNRPIGRILLFDLTRHSDHHAFATRKYQVLRHHDEAPQLPAGYSAMILLSFVPPLFHRVMEPHLHAWEQRYGGQAVAAK